MSMIYTSLDAIAVQVMKTNLEGHGIACEIRGENRAIAMGETPLDECWLELWILDDSQAEEARSLLGS